MTTFYRRDDWVLSSQGQAVPNVSVTYYAQPGMTLATVYANGSGTPTSNPQVTDNLGHAEAYLPAGLYTIVYSGQPITTLTLADQEVAHSAGSTLSVMTPTGTPNGVLRSFTLTGSVPDPTNGQLYLLSGGQGTLIPYGAAGYTISGTTLTWNAAVPPQTGDSLEYYFSSGDGELGLDVDVVLQTNGVNNADQSTLNLQNGTGTTVTNPSGGAQQVSVIYGATANTAAQGNDSRIVNALQDGTYQPDWSASSGSAQILNKPTGLAPLASPAFTGTPTAPTPASTDSSTRIATTAWSLLGFVVAFAAGYIRFPSWLADATGKRLLIKWGTANGGSPTFDPTIPFGATPSVAATFGASDGYLVSVSTTGFTTGNVSSQIVSYIAIGHD